jgi:hypothetical protein
VKTVVTVLLLSSFALAADEDVSKFVGCYGISYGKGHNYLPRYIELVQSPSPQDKQWRVAHIPNGKVEGWRVSQARWREIGSDRLELSWLNVAQMNITIELGSSAILKRTRSGFRGKLMLIDSAASHDDGEIVLTRTTCPIQ